MVDRARQRIPRPGQRAVAHVVRPDHAGLQAHGAVVADGRADNDEVADDGGGRRDGIVALAVAADSRREIHLAISPEVGTRDAGTGVDRHQAGIERPEEHPLAARRWRRRRALPSGDAARREHLAVFAREVHAGVVRPHLLPGGRVEREKRGCNRSTRSSGRRRESALPGTSTGCHQSPRHRWHRLCGRSMAPRDPQRSPA